MNASHFRNMKMGGVPTQVSRTINDIFGVHTDMEIIEIKENKKQFLPLLLLADEQESMIDRYIDRGTMYVLVDNGVKCECVVTDEGKGILEIKNIATAQNIRAKVTARH